MSLDDDADVAHGVDVRLCQAVVAAMNGWTQKALEAATGIPQSRISSIRRNYRGERPTLDEIVKIERAVGLPIGFILAFAGLATVEGARRGTQASARAAKATKPRSAGPT